MSTQQSRPTPIAVENFKVHIQKFYKYGYTMMSLILGYDLGLFDVLHKAEVPLAATEIAEQADLKERYVQEWLGAVTAANVIAVHEDNGVNRYTLPTEYYDTLIANVALCKGVSECVKRLGYIKECFKKQGPMGDPHAFDGEFWKFFGEFRDECIVAKQVQNELFPKLESVEELRNLLEAGCDAIDIGCGNGALTMAFGSQYPNSSFTGIDTDDKSITEAKEKLESLWSECRNIEFQLENTTDLVHKVGEHYDVVLMFQALHNLPDPIKMIKEVNDILKAGGKLVLIEMKLHSNHLHNVDNLCSAAQYSFSQFFCLPFSMSDKPHLGFGMGWGEENLLVELRKFFKLDARFEHGDIETLFVLSKTEGMT